MATFTSLPNEIKTIVFEFLSLKNPAASRSAVFKHHIYECRDALLALTLVSRDIKNLVTPILYSSIYRCQPGKRYIAAGDFQVQNAGFHHARSLRIDATVVSNVAQYLSSVGFGSRLTSLTLYTKDHSIEDLVQNLAGHAHLEHLTVWTGPREASAITVGHSDSAGKAPFPLGKLVTLTATHTDLVRLHSIYAMSIPTYVIMYSAQATGSDEPQPQGIGHADRQPDFFEVESASMSELVLQRRTSPQLSALPSSLASFALVGAQMDKATWAVLSTLPSLKCLQMDEQADTWFLSNLPQRLEQVIYCTDNLHHVQVALDAIGKSTTLETCNLWYIDIGFDLEEANSNVLDWNASSPIINKIKRAQAKVLARKGELEVDLDEVWEYYRTRVRQCPYPYGTLDHTRRRLLIPNTAQESLYAINRLCTAASVEGGLLQLLDSHNALASRFAELLAVSLDVARRLLDILKADGHLVSIDGYAKEAIFNEGADERETQTLVPTPKLYSEYYAWVARGQW